MWKRLGMLWTVLRVDARRVWWALRHPATPFWFKAGVALTALYLISPVDLIPEVLPVIGVVDDLILVPLVLRWLLARLPPQVAQATQRGAVRPRP